MANYYYQKYRKETLFYLIDDFIASLLKIIVLNFENQRRRNFWLAENFFVQELLYLLLYFMYHIIKVKF